MATVKKGILVRAGEWWKHLRSTKRQFWKKHRRAEKKMAKESKSLERLAAATGGLFDAWRSFSSSPDVPSHVAASQGRP